MYLLRFVVLSLALSVMLRPAGAAETVLISEFMASNLGELVDEDGDSSDWIEIHNSGSDAVDLNGWCLTDKASNLTQWRFPSTNLAANGYLIVFASGKNRRTPGAPLHTSFQLKASGEFLALVHPDGTNIACAYAPLYPPQVGSVSYGIPMQQIVTPLIDSNATARVLVPADGSLGESWRGILFDDSSWALLPVGIGFENNGPGPFVPAPLADSVGEFSGVQGQNNWFYGYWDKTLDADGLYNDSEFVPFPNSGAVYGADNFWTGTSWRWFNGAASYPELSSVGGRPSGVGDGPAPETRWAVRRYVSEVEGTIAVSGNISHTSDWVYVTATGLASNSTLYVFLDGAGEGYLDELKLVAGTVPEVGANLVANGGFDTTSLSSWTVASIFSGSATTTNIVHGGTRSLHIVSTGSGSQSAAIKQTVSPSLTTGQAYTLSYWYLPVPNGPSLKIQGKNLWLNSTATACGDGTVARIFVDGVEVFEQAARLSSSNYSLTLPVSLGSRVDFALDPGPANDAACDATTFTAAIQTAPSPPMVVADSVADWSLTGAQGEKNWSYGYYDQTADSVSPDYQAGDFIPFPHAAGPHGPANFWDGQQWEWWNGSPPFDRIAQRTTTPNGSNSGHIHWVIRRWRSTVSGPVTVDWSLIKPDPSGAGVTARIFQNGIQMDSVSVPAISLTTISRSTVLSNVQLDDLIDLALDPAGAGGDTTDTGDQCLVSAVIRGQPNLGPEVTSNIGAAMANVNATAYLRFPFVVPEPSVIEFLTLRMKYDDGFIAYLNGQLVASANAPLLPAWNSAATASHPDAAAAQFEEFNLTSARDLLQAGTNILAIQGLNVSAIDPDFLIWPELVATQVSFDPAVRAYFTMPTPGAPNGAGTASVGPLIVSAGHTPIVPQAGQDLLVTATVLPTFNPIGSVRLISRVMYGSEVNVAMFDDGLHGDGAAGDGVFGATIPGGVAQAGEMVRYYVYATDTGTNSSVLPAYDDPQNSAQYLGTVVLNPALTNPLPVLHMFVQNPVLATNYSGTRCSIFFLNEFHDNISVNLHGQTTADVFEKRSFNLGMNPGEPFLWNPEAKRVGAIDLITTASDKAYMRQVMAYETFTAAGVPSHFAFPVRVQQNNGLYGVMHMVENGDKGFLDRVGLNSSGALYKLYLPLTNAYGGVAEKKTRKNEGNDDLQALINGCQLQGAPLRTYLYDHVDIPELVNFLATIQVVDNEDCCDYKNYYLYHDNDGNGEWQMLPYDLDLTFGRVFTAWVFKNGVWTGGYYDTNIFWQNRWYSETRSTLDFIGDANPVAEALWSVPEMFNMFVRRWSTVQEQFLQTNNTHPLLLKYERRVDELAALIGPDAVPDIALWGTFPPTQTLPQAVAVLKTNYFAPRRGWIFNTLLYANGGPYLGPQPTNALINFGAIDFNPASGNQAEEYIELANPNNYELDISGWKLAGAVDYTFRGGVVIPRLSSIYVSPNVNAFRARATGPRGGQGLLVQGNYQGQLSARGELLQVLDRGGRAVNATNYLGNPSLAQQYLRVSEIMYHPAPPPPGLPVDAEQFEFVEVLNTGPVPLDLTGVRFTAGVTFDFTGSAVTHLDAGASALVVRNLAVFNSRYGALPNVAGQFGGALDNQGETLRLDDRAGEKILEFSYDPLWYPITDGAGFSLVIVDSTAPWDTWGLKSSWRPSGSVGGSPGQPDVSVAPPAPILLSEALTYASPPGVTALELYNPTAGSVDVNGWYLTDDFLTPKKYVIHDQPAMLPGGYLVLTENDFNGLPWTPGNFALNPLGGELYLFSADTNGNLTGYDHGFAYGAAEEDVSFGRYVTSVGQEFFGAQAFMSLGGSNSAPRVGPVVISEIHYHPPDLPGGEDDSMNEYIELQNITSKDVPLFDPLVPTNTWHLRGVVDLDLPTGVTLGASNFLLLVNFDPTNTAQVDAFRSRFGVPAGVAVVGPYQGKLDNSAGAVRLSKPGSPFGSLVPHVLVDEVDYADSAPWPALADGAGASLHRLVPYAFGNDPANWTAAHPTPGLPYVSGAAPVIVVQPSNQVAIASASPAFTVLGAGAGPLRYQWRFNGDSLPGATNASLTVTNVLSANAGAYSVAVFNDQGSVLSSNAVLSVLYGAFFTRQPTNAAVAAGSSVTFSAAAWSSSSIHYQWQLNGTNLPGATSATLSISGVQPAKTGFYQVIATDSVGSIPSAYALLTVLGPPVITTQPRSITITNGSPAAFSAAATGTAPLGYQWRLNGTNLAGQNSPSLPLSNPGPADTGGYSLVVTNNLGSVTSLVAALTILTPPIITTQPLSQPVHLGSNATLVAVASGSEPLSYQWWFSSNGSSNSVLVTATNASLVVSNAQLPDAGQYRLVVTNPAGAVTSMVAVVTLIDGDADGDGLPDFWELAHGLNPFLNDAGEDPDHDGMSNWQEYQAGTDPQDPASYLKIDHLAAEPNARTLSFLALSNRTYTVQYRERTGDGAWLSLSSILARETNRVEAVTDVESGIDSRFYRLVTPAQP